MPVNTKNSAYTESEDRWVRCRDCYEGSDAIKAAGVKYLPQLDSHRLSGGGAAYEAYKSRALFFNAMGRTVDGFAGAVFQKSPTIKLEPEQEDVLEPEMEPEIGEDLTPKLDDKGNPVMKPKVGPDGKPVLKPKLGPDGKPLKKPMFGAEPALPEDELRAKTKPKLGPDGKPMPKLGPDGKPIKKIDPETGEPVQKLDDNGEPMVDENGDPVHEEEIDQEENVSPDEGEEEPEIDPETGEPKVGPDGKPIMKKVGAPELDENGEPKRDETGNIIRKPLAAGKPPVMGPDGKPIPEEEPEVDEATGKPKVGPDGKPIMKKLGEPHVDEFGKPVVGPDGQPIRKPVLPEKKENPIKKHLLDITLTGVGFDLFAFEALQEVLTTGRYGILVDMADTEIRDKQRPYWAGYEAESIINWTTDRIEGEEQLIQVVLREEVEVPDLMDPFATTKEERFRVLKLENGTYTQEIWASGKSLRDFQSGLTQNEDGSSSRVSTLTPPEQGSKSGALPYSLAAQRAMYNGEPTSRPMPPPDLGKGKQAGDWGVIEVITPVRRGKPLTWVPFYFINSTGSQATVSKPPLLDLADLNLSHYRTLADLEHGRHFVALPTPWISGAAVNEQNEVQIGPSGVLILEKGGAAGMLEFSGAGLRALETADEQKRKMMAVLGARLLEEQALAAETATAVGMRHSGEQAVLRTIAQVLENQLTRALRAHCWWVGTEKEPSDLSYVVVELSKDFYAMKMQPAELAQLLAALQADGISYKTFYYNLAVGGITRPGIDSEEEQREIANKPEDGPGKMPNGPDAFHAGTPFPNPQPRDGSNPNPQFGLPNNGAPPQRPAPPKGVTPPQLAMTAAATKAAAAKAKGGSPFGRLR